MKRGKPHHGTEPSLFIATSEQVREKSTMSERIRSPLTGSNTSVATMWVHGTMLLSRNSGSVHGLVESAIKYRHGSCKECCEAMQDNGDLHHGRLPQVERTAFTN